MTQIQFLEIVRDHPEGLSTSEITAIMYPTRNVHEWVKRVYIYGKKLQKYGLVKKILSKRPDKTTVAVWFPAVGA